MLKEKKRVFQNVPPSRRNVTGQVEDIARNLKLKNRAAAFNYFSMPLDGGCNVHDTDQLLILSHGITADFYVAAGSHVIN